MATKPFSKASFHEPKSDAQGNTKEVLLHEKHGNVVYSDQEDKPDHDQTAWIFENNNSEFRSNYQIFDEDRIIQFNSSFHLTTKQKEMKHYPPLRYDSIWLQHANPLEPMSLSSNSFKTRVVDIGESLRAVSTNTGITNTGIEIGLAYKIDSNRETPHVWEEFGCHYNFLNGGIYYDFIFPMKFVERGEVNDVIEWSISASNTDQGQEIKSAVFKINGQPRGKPIAIERDEDLFPTLHIVSSGAKVESGFQDMDYPEKPKGGFDEFWEYCHSGYLNNACEFRIPLFRIAHFLASVYMIVDMITDLLITIHYYEYGVNPSSFKSNQTKGTRIQLNSVSTTTTVEISSNSTDFSYFYIACWVWTLTPCGHIVMNLSWYYDPTNLYTITYCSYVLIEHKFEKYGFTRIMFRKMCLFRKILFMILIFLMVILEAIVTCYIRNPLVIMRIAFGNSFPTFCDQNVTEKLSNIAKLIKCGEAVGESFGQCILAIVFYSINKSYYDCPHPMMPMLTKGAVFVISIYFNVLSITIALINLINRELTLAYGEDWWKLWKRIKVWRQIWWVLLFNIAFIAILIGIMIRIIYL